MSWSQLEEIPNGKPETICNQIDNDNNGLNVKYISMTPYRQK